MASLALSALLVLLSVGVACSLVLPKTAVAAHVQWLATGPEQPRAFRLTTDQHSWDVHLRPSKPKSLPVYVYGDNTVEQHSYSIDRCHWDVFVPADQLAFGSVHACSGQTTVRGHLVIGGRAFHISPSSHGNGKHDLEELPWTTPKRRSKTFSYTLELVLVADSGTFSLMGNNVNTATSYLITLANLVDILYQSLDLGVNVELKSAVVWSVNQVPTSSSPQNMLTSFSTWGRNSTLPHDGMALVKGAGFSGGARGLAFEQSNPCSANAFYSVNAVWLDLVAASSATSQAYTAQIIAHETAHNLGATHSGVSPNTCSGAFIMNSSPGTSPSATWSSCTKSAISSGLNGETCLQTAASATQQSCGVGFYSTGGGTQSSRCAACDSSCLECSGGAVNQCTRCDPSKLLSEGRCVSACLNGFYAKYDGGSIPVDLFTTGRYCAQCNQAGTTCATGEVVTCDSSGGNFGCGAAQSYPAGASPSEGGGSNGGAIAAGILVPLIIIGGVIAWIYYLRQHGLTCKQWMDVNFKQDSSTVTVNKSSGAVLSAAHRRTSSLASHTNRNAYVASSHPTASTSVATPVASPGMQATVVKVSPSTTSVPQATTVTAAPPPVPPRRYVEPPLPANWHRYIDEDTQAPYYYNDVTGESSWEVPTE